MKVFEALLDIKANGPKDLSLGICNAIDDGYDLYTKAFKNCFEAWPKYSGDSSYPVPSSVSGDSAGWAFNSTKADRMWNPEDPYGALRLELLDHCIEWFKSRDL